jgi:hypothetical protein
MSKTIHRHPALDDGHAFLPDFRRGFVRPRDGDVEALGEEFITAATSADAIAELARDDDGNEDGYQVLSYESLRPLDPSSSTRFRPFLFAR